MIKHIANCKSQATLAIHLMIRLVFMVIKSKEKQDNLLIFYSII